MDKETSNLTMIGVILIVLSFVIGLGLGVFSLSRGVTNEGVVSVQDKLDSAQKSDFIDVDQQVVTGTQVISMYKKIKGRPIAILVHTHANGKGVIIHTESEGFIQSINDKNYINYNAVLANDSAGNISTLQKAQGGSNVVDGNKGIFSLKDGVVYTIHGFAINEVTGKIILNNAIKGFEIKGTSEYIEKNSKFEANLIKDSSGTIVGILFTQV